MVASTKNVYQRLLEAQAEAVAPREINGRFGKARSAEQILEAIKPVCRKHGLFLHTTDVIHQVGDRNYITTTARVVNVDKPEEFVEAEASAWENSASGGLDTSQVTGKTSSYAKKYALQNLFAIDDTKDADFSHDENVDSDPGPQAPEEPQQSYSNEPTEKQLNMIKMLSRKLNMNETVVDQRLSLIHTKDKASEAIEKLQAKLEEKGEAA
jgi:hypothetical protein